MRRAHHQNRLVLRPRRAILPSDFLRTFGYRYFADRAHRIQLLETALRRMPQLLNRVAVIAPRLALHLGR